MNLNLFLRDAGIYSIIPLDLLTGAISLNLSVHNRELDRIDLLDVAQMSSYIEGKIREAGARAALGGYGEDRAVYRRSPIFGEGEQARTIHLGVDIWCPAGTPVFAPLSGNLHSFRVNAGEADYGPTIIIEHKTKTMSFYTLYGHLSLDSLHGLQTGQSFSGGDRIGWLGNAHENGHWPAHLHFQVILDLQGKEGDYPGVCSRADWPFYRKNCPDPQWLLAVGSKN